MEGEKRRGRGGRRKEGERGKEGGCEEREREGRAKDSYISSKTQTPYQKGI